MDILQENVFVVDFKCRHGLMPCSQVRESIFQQNQADSRNWELLYFTENYISE